MATSNKGLLSEDVKKPCKEGEVMIPTVIDLDHETGEVVRLENNAMGGKTMKDPLELLIEQESAKMKQEMEENLLNELGLQKAGALAIVFFVATLP